MEMRSRRRRKRKRIILILIEYRFEVTYSSEEEVGAGIRGVELYILFDDFDDDEL
jgi:hypothetical protein